MAKKFEQNVDLDAFMVKAGLEGGKDSFLEAAWIRRNDFPGGPDTAVARAEWMKKQPKAYIDQVVARVTEMTR